MPSHKGFNKRRTEKQRGKKGARIGKRERLRALAKKLGKIQGRGIKVE